MTDTAAGRLIEALKFMAAQPSPEGRGIERHGVAVPISGHDVVQTVILPEIAKLRPPAEPRWPSGEAAERELAAALRLAESRDHGLFGHEHTDRERTAAILAALQEKRDPGE